MGMCCRNGLPLAIWTLSLLVTTNCFFLSTSRQIESSRSVSNIASFDEQTTTTARILESVQQDHKTEVANGFKTWGHSTEYTPTKEWTDDDFISRSVGKGNAGPHEHMLKRGDEIFQTMQPVLTTEECEQLITEARQVIAAGLEKEGNFQNTSGQGQPTNSQLGEARVSQMPRAQQWLRQALHERFFPILESRFGLSASELTLNDALVIGYGYFGQKSRSQPVHRDADLLSLNVALSTQDSFDPNGGGTFFEGLPAESSIVQMDQGHVLCHSGGVQHAGRGISSGERWVLVLFAVADSEPQLARRCHAKGLIHRENGNVQEAEDTFRAGLTVAPKDHLLLTSLGGVFMAKEQETLARAQLSAAASAYEHCQKANLALGRMMLANRRPRAALRRFDAVSDYLNDSDLVTNSWMPLKAMGWDARVYGSHAAILCSQEAMKNGIKDFDTGMYLQRAMERLNVALSAVPGDERILSMLDRVKELLAYHDQDSDKSSSSATTR